MFFECKIYKFLPTLFYMAFYKVPYKMGGTRVIIYIKAENLKQARESYKKITGEKKSKKAFRFYTTKVPEEEVKEMDLENILGHDFYWIVKMNSNGLR